MLWYCRIYLIVWLCGAKLHSVMSNPLHHYTNKHWKLWIKNTWNGITAQFWKSTSCSVLTVLSSFLLSNWFLNAWTILPAALCPYVTKTNPSRIATRGLAYGNCRVAQRKTTFGHSSFSVKGIHLWNALPTEMKTLTDLKIFNEKVKNWLKQNQICNHWLLIMHWCLYIGNEILLCYICRCFYLFYVWLMYFNYNT